MMIERPSANEYAPYYVGYVSLVPESDVLPVLEGQIAGMRAALAPVSEERAGFRYAPEKWSIRQVVGHLVDAERVFGYRALRIARGDPTPLPGYDENGYAARSGHDACRLTSLVDELDALRRSHVAMFAHLDPEATRRAGTANGQPISARALGFIMAGHVRHHLAVLASLYGVA